MGKSKTKSQSSKTFGVRYMPLKDEVITFRATGKIDYEFSTTGRSYMALQGNMVREDCIETYKSWKREANKYNIKHMVVVNKLDKRIFT